MKVSGALILLWGLPLLVGRVGAGRAASWPVRWWLGVCWLGLAQVVTQSLGLPHAVASGFVLTAVLCLLARFWGGGADLPPAVRDGGPRARGSRGVDFAITASLLALYGIGTAEALSHPVEHWDAVAIWQSKVDALTHGRSVSETLMPNYPILGPALAALLVRCAGGDEAAGRILFPALYVVWGLSVCSRRRPVRRPWVAGVIPVLLWLGFEPVAFTSGYQDCFVLACGGMAAWEFCQVLLDSEGTDGSQPFDSHAAFRGAFFCGMLGLIKNEGAVLAVLLALAFGVALCARRGPARLLWRQWAPALGVTAGLLCVWPALLLWQGQDLAQVQGASFTLAGVWQIPANCERLPQIGRQLAAYWGGSGSLTPAALALSLVAGWLAPRLRRALVFLWLTVAGQTLFVGLVFLATRQNVQWHLDTALERLMFQSQFAVIEALALALMLLLDEFADEVARMRLKSPS